ncbi:hypothetical protein VZT92_007901 [Zoarces viviparus]|uniref:Uncharacterized protein n=1 Tax=Zoarces viviparus TaxID=48416 RepID=A0AAW1FMU7_ZOAVI
MGWCRSHTNPFGGWFNPGGDNEREAGSSPPPVSASQIIALVCAIILLKRTKRDQQVSASQHRVLTRGFGLTLCLTDDSQRWNSGSTSK